MNNRVISMAGLAVASVEELVFGHAPHPVKCGNGLTIGAGRVVPEINFTLPPVEISPSTWPEIESQYTEMMTAVCERAVDLGAPELLVEFETLPPMTVDPSLGASITSLLASILHTVQDRHGIRSALRLTPNDTRDHRRPPLMRSGDYWENMVRLFSSAAGAGADLLAIESTGGKEIHDEALMNADLEGIVYALGILAPRDMEFLWRHMVQICHDTGIVASGDTACGFANTAMALASQRMIPKVLAALVRVASVPRGLIAFQQGAIGPSKDCAYEGPYFKAIAGVPISMEGRSAACAHLSPLGNIPMATCDCWSNESVQNVRLLSAQAPVVSVDQLVFDCRLLNQASLDGRDGALLLRKWLENSDALLDPQAYILKAEIVLSIAARIVEQPTPYLQTRAALIAAIDALTKGVHSGELVLSAVELHWLNRLESQAMLLTEDEEKFTAQMVEKFKDSPYIASEYGL